MGGSVLKASSAPPFSHAYWTAPSIQFPLPLLLASRIARFSTEHHVYKILCCPPVVPTGPQCCTTFSLPRRPAVTASRMALTSEHRSLKYSIRTPSRFSMTFARELGSGEGYLAIAYSLRLVKLPVIVVDAGIRVAILDKKTFTTLTHQNLNRS
jgi:hypothetical protein